LSSRRKPKTVPRTPSGTARRTGWPLLYAVALIAAAVATYANAITLPFVYDDIETIVDNPHIATFWPIQAPVQSAVAGRPVVTLSLALNFALGGLSPAGYRLGNLAVHILCGLLLFGIIRRTLARPTMPEDFQASAAPLAFATALVWLVHPLHTEVIDYVTQRTESMMGLFLLATLYAAMRSMTEPESSARGWRVASVAACTLGMATKESMVTAPVLVALYDIAFESGSVREAWQRRGKFYVALASTWIVLAVLNWYGPRWRSAGFSSGVTPWTYLLNQALMIVTYLKLTLWPDPLVLDYGVPLRVSIRDVWPAALAVLTLAAATLVAWRSRPRLAFLGTWFFVLLAPSSSVIPIATEVGAERRMYLPLAAIVILVVIGIWQLTSRSPEKTRIRVAILAIACSACMALGIRRNTEFRTDLSIWQSVLDRRPSGRAHYSVGLALAQSGRRAEAVTHLTIATRDYPEAHYAVGFELDLQGDHESALAHYREFVRLRPDDRSVPRAYHQMGRASMALGRPDEAAAAFEEVLRMRPGNLDALSGLADARLQEKHYEEAIDAYQKYISIDPKNPAAYNNLALALVAVDREPDAVTYFAKALELRPGDVAGRENLGMALAASGRLEEAIAQFRMVLTAEPNRASAREALNEALAARGPIAR